MYSHDGQSAELCNCISLWLGFQHNASHAMQVLGASGVAAAVAVSLCIMYILSQGLLSTTPNAV